jgi:hypothetical protein
MLPFRVFIAYDASSSIPPSPEGSQPHHASTLLEHALVSPLPSIASVPRQKPSRHSTPLFPMVSGLFCAMDACNPFLFNRLRTLSIAVGVYTPLGLRPTSAKRTHPPQRARFPAPSRGEGCAKAWGEGGSMVFAARSLKHPNALLSLGIGTRPRFVFGPESSGGLLWIGGGSRQ